MKNNKLVPEEVLEHARYKIYREYYGMFSQCEVIAYVYSMQTAKMICDALSEKYAGRPMTFSYILCAEYDEVLDEHPDNWTFPDDQ